MDEFTKPEFTPTIHGSVMVGREFYTAGREREFALAIGERGIDAVADLRRLTEAGTISGFEGVMDRLLDGGPAVVVTLDSGKAKSDDGEDDDDDKSSEEEEVELPPVGKLAEFLKKYDDPKVIRAIAEQDERSTAKAIYEQRLAELEG